MLKLKLCHDCFGNFSFSNNIVTASRTLTVKLSMPMTTKGGGGVMAMHCCSRLIIVWAIQSTLVEMMAESCEYCVLADLAAVSVLV